MVFLAGWGFLSSMPARSQTDNFRNLSLSDDERVDAVIRQLTLDEKIHLLSTDLGVPRLGIPTCGQVEGLHGLSYGGPGNWGQRITLPNGQRSQIEFPSTIFPQSYGLGETWDPELIRRIGAQEAEEIRYYSQTPTRGHRSALVVRSPNADLARDPRWGRTEESYGEDPFLTATLTVAMIHGLQGDHPRYWKTAALMKHFLANSNEDGRDSTSSNFDNRLFRDYYSYPFYKGITEGGSRAFMASYNAWNGTVMCVNPILDSIARREWGNNGIICTDGGALRLLVNAHHAYPDLPEGAAAVVKATTGQFLDTYDEYVRTALQRGILTETDIDRAIRGNLFVALKLGLLDPEGSDNPYTKIGADSMMLSPVESEQARMLAREAMAKSVVLLKNEGGLLPIDASKVRRLAVIGPYADKVVQDWYSGHPPYEVTILQALREQAEVSGMEVRYVGDNRMGQAEQLAAWADLALVCVGNHPFGTRTDWFFCPVPSDGREAVDRKSMQLPDEDLLRLAYRANPNTVMVLVSSFPYTVNWSQEHLPAIVHITHCCQEQGHGLADVLFGRVNPAGRTTQTWPRDILDLPPMMDYDIRHGRTYMYTKNEPLYPFGFGLSYTRFHYGKVRKVETSDAVVLSFSLHNEGDYDGEEVVQVYAEPLSPQADMPSRRLCAFQRVHVDKGQTKTVQVRVRKSDLTQWDESSYAFVPYSVPFRLLIGASSVDIRQTVE